MIKTYCGVDCCSECPRLPECGGCEICQGHPFGGSCVAQRNRDFPALKKRLIEEINALQIKGLSVCNLNLLNGAYVNLEYPLVNGSSVRFLKDEDIYFGNQIEREESERCFGVVADESFILVCEYGYNGADPEIVLYKRREDSYVCRIASLEEVNERWDTLIREHPEDPNWAVWKTDVLAEVSAGKEIPYYGFLGGEIICEAYAIPNYTPGEDDKGYREDGTAYLSAFRTVKAYRGKGFFRNFFTSCLMTSERRTLQEPFWESSRMRCSTSRCIFIGALPRKCTQEPAPTRTGQRLKWNTMGRILPVFRERGECVKKLCDEIQT